MYNSVATFFYKSKCCIATFVNEQIKNINKNMTISTSTLSLSYYGGSAVIDNIDYTFVAHVQCFHKHLPGNIYSAT